MSATSLTLGYWWGLTRRETRAEYIARNRYNKSQLLKRITGDEPVRAAIAAHVNVPVSRIVNDAFIANKKAMKRALVAGLLEVCDSHSEET